MKNIKKRWICFMAISIMLFVSVLYVRAVLIDCVVQNDLEKKPEQIEQYDCIANYRADFDTKKQQEFYNILKQTSFKFIPREDDNFELYLSAGRSVESHLVGNAGLDLRDLKLYDFDLKSLVDVPIVWLDLSGTRVTDAGMKTLSEIKSLKYLLLNATTISDEPVKKISDASIPYFSKMTNLEVLELISADITDKTIIAIAENCKKIRHLELAGTCIDGSGFKAFSSDSLLEYVGCGGKINDETIKYLTRLKNLKIVEFAFTDVSDKGLMQFVKCHNINRIGVECSAVTRRGVNKFIKKRKDVFIRIGMGIED
jgi:hypothetical protein